MFRRSKKGVFDLPLEQTVGLVLAVMFVILIIAVIAGLMRAFTAPPDQGTGVMFNKIFNGIKAMSSPANTNTSCKIVNGYIEANYAVVGFNKQGLANVKGETDGFIHQYCGKIWDKVNRPTSCYDKACLCLCKAGYADTGGDDCMKKGATCLRFDYVDQLTSSREGKPIDLVIYGKSCMLALEITKTKYGVTGGYLINKNGNSYSVESVTNEVMKTKNMTPDCVTLANSFGYGTVAKPENKTEEAKVSNLCTDSQAKGGGCAGTITVKK